MRFRLWIRCIHNLKEAAMSAVMGKHGTDPEVLVIGAGHAGLTLAIDLLRRGAAVRIVSAASGGFPGSRAKGVQPRTQEVFDDLGVLDDVASHATTYPSTGVHQGKEVVPGTM